MIHLSYGGCWTLIHNLHPPSFATENKATFQFGGQDLEINRVSANRTTECLLVIAESTL
jgi:hypothetical protein